MNVVRRCPFCGKETTKEFKKTEIDAYASGKNILEAMPERNVFDMEFILTGMCDSCQSNTFNIPIPGDNSWGEKLGTCPVCDCGIHSVKNKQDSAYRCPTCHALLDLANSELVEVED